MTSAVYIGIDPGSNSGAIAYIYEVGGVIVKYDSYPIGKMTEKEMVDKLVMLKNTSTNVHAVLEQVHSMPGQGVSSSFKFGQNYGMLRGFLLALAIPFTQVTPQKWIKLYGMKKAKEESKTDWKRRLRGQAEQLFPKVKMTNDKADALLISKYCKEINK